MDCPKCFEFTLSDCLDSFVVDAGLIPETTYYYRITDKFGNKYSGSFETTNDGRFTIDVDDFPQGLFTAYSGAFTLEVSLNLIPFSPVNFWLCDVEYPCISFSFGKADATWDTIYCISTQPTPTPQPVGVFSFAGKGNDTTIIVFDGTITSENPLGFNLIGKTLLSIATDGIQRNFNPFIPPVDLTFDNITGTLTFVGDVSSDTIITGTYK